MSIITDITGLFTGTTITKWLAIGGAACALAIGAYLYGHHEGTLAESAAVAAAAAKQDQKTIVVTQKQTVVDTTAVTALQKQLDTVKGQNIGLQKQLAAATAAQLATATTTNGTTSCQLTTDWTSIYNQSIGAAK